MDANKLAVEACSRGKARVVWDKMSVKLEEYLQIKFQEMDHDHSNIL